MKLSCARCGKRLSRKSARLIDKVVLCSTCMFAPQGIDPKGLRGFRPDRRRSAEPDATEGRELATATAERDARVSLALWPGRAKLRRD